MQHMQVLQDSWLNNATSAHRRAPRITSGLGENTDGHIHSIPNRKPSEPPTTETSPEHATVNMDETKSALQPRFAVFDVVGRSCSLRCQCVCYEQRPFRSPAGLSLFFGSLFVSRNSLRTCNSKACQARMRRVAYTYAFPFWFLDRVFTASMTTSIAKGPELLIRFMRIRAPRSEIFRFSSYGPLRYNARNPVKALLDNGEASVLDTTPSGLTALHVWKTVTMK